MANAPDPSSIVNDLEPEMKEGPLGIPVIAPKGAPEPPLSGDGNGPGGN